MNLINLFTDKDANSGKAEELTGWNVRQSVRAVLLNDKNQVALMHIGTNNVYKLPGGGMEEGESIDATFAREMLEETGCEAEKIAKLGICIEKRDEWKLIQISHCFVAKVTKIGSMYLDGAEEEQKFTLFWADSIEAAIGLMKLNNPQTYDDRFMNVRDIDILKKALSQSKNAL